MKSKILVIALTVALLLSGFGSIVYRDGNSSSMWDFSNGYPTIQTGEWVEKKSTLKAGAWGEAVVGTGNNIYIAWCRSDSKTPEFWRYDPNTNEWHYSMSVSALPTGAFRSGTALAWDHGDFIYALLGGRKEDSNRRLFYRYSISNDNWEQLADTLHAQGAGDAITWSEDGRIYAIMGSNKLGKSYFARYDPSTNSWENLSLTWSGTDDGASLVWTGGEYLYALQGEWEETEPNRNFVRYNLFLGIWEDMENIPETEGVGDGGSLLWTDEYNEYIFALGGGSCYPEDPGYNFYCYTISENSWEQLESIPCPIGYYVGNRLGFTNEHIYYWQGSPTVERWICGGKAFYRYQPTIDTNPPDTTITSGPSGTIDYNDVTFEWTGSDDTNSTEDLVYSYKLEGYDASWSSWTSSTSKTYNDLPDDDYTFKVKAKDEAGNEDPTPATRTLTIEVEESGGIPGFELVLLVAAIAIVLLWRRKQE